MKRHISYLKYILRHKYYVFKHCLRLGVPLWRAIVHDWTKFLPSEWMSYAYSFYNTDGTRRVWHPQKKMTVEAVEIKEAFDRAWNAHQKANKHHWQYWVLINDEDGWDALEMPHTYVMEMCADWKGAGQAISGKVDALGWYTRNKDKMILHPRTRAMVEACLSWEKLDENTPA